MARTPLGISREFYGEQIGERAAAWLEARIIEAIREAVAAEREAQEQALLHAARAERYWPPACSWPPAQREDAARALWAAAIRARTEGSDGRS